MQLIPPPRFPRLARILEDDWGNRRHIGAQFYIQLSDKPVLELAYGDNGNGQPLSSESRMPWLSAGKPLTALLINQLIESGALKLDSTVSHYLPLFAHGGKNEITIRHLLTHTGGFRSADRLPESLDWNETIQQICQTPLESGWIPGQKGGYHISSSWFILAELAQKIAGVPFHELIHQRVLVPLGLMETGFTLQDWNAREVRMHITAGQLPAPHPLLNDLSITRNIRPGSSARGPARELAKFYFELLKACHDETRIIKSETALAMTSRQRNGIYDQTFMHVVDFGLGVLINSNRYGAETVPYSFGRHASEATFGHGGAQCAAGFADPDKKLAVAWILNGMAGERLHNRRAREINSAIYEDLFEISS
ncbi:MAG: serine hydrolase domain-containing protein [Verrucomicrobiota bacterium]|nr:serine hydrolase domain-containing protein [Verrucomicrobiota bacterium]